MKTKNCLGQLTAFSFCRSLFPFLLSSYLLMNETPRIFVITRDFPSIDTNTNAMQPQLSSNVINARKSQTLIVPTAAESTPSHLTNIWLLLITSIPLSGIIIGFLFRYDCPLERFIAIWEIINGSMTIVFLFFVYVTKHHSTKQTFVHRLIARIQHRTWTSFVIDQLKILCIFFLFTWFICGNVSYPCPFVRSVTFPEILFQIWTYSHYSEVQYEKSLNSTNSLYCHRILYLHAFSYMTTVYILLGSCLIVFVFTLLLTCIRR